MHRCLREVALQQAMQHAIHILVSADCCLQFGSKFAHGSHVSIDL